MSKQAFCTVCMLCLTPCHAPENERSGILSPSRPSRARLDLLDEAAFVSLLQDGRRDGGGRGRCHFGFGRIVREIRQVNTQPSYMRRGRV